MSFVAKKSLGQNFLNDNKVIKIIADLGKIECSDFILEVGAGIGSFTTNYFANFKNVTLCDLDNENIKILKTKFNQNKNITVVDKRINELEGKFDTIIYLNVLEHIKEDINEINSAIEKLNPEGHLDKKYLFPFQTVFTIILILHSFLTVLF